MTADVAGAAGGRDELQRDRHLADGAVRPDRQDHPLARQMPAPDGRLHALRRPPVVDEPRAGRGGRGRELRVVADELVQPGVDVEPGLDRREDDRAPRAGQLAAGRGDADEQPVGADRLRPAPRRASPRTGCRARAGTRDRFRPAMRRVEDGHDVVAAVADDAHRGLGVVDAELALGQDDQAAGVGGGHAAQSTERKTPPGRGPGAREKRGASSRVTSYQGTAMA